MPYRQLFGFRTHRFVCIPDYPRFVRSSEENGLQNFNYVQIAIHLIYVIITNIIYIRMP